MINSEIPNLQSFVPLPMQYEVLKDLNLFDYELGTHEIMLSGSVGSSKSIVLAHKILKHCLTNKRARVLIGRRALPDLKATLYAKILEHMEGVLVERKHYYKNDGQAYIKFANGSEIISRSWADRKYSKVRSLELSAAAIEELTENEEQDFYNEIKMRVGRLPHIREKFIICATNPDAPSHWAYKYFIEGENSFQTRHVYYSRTEDNIYLPKSYVAQLKNDLDPKLARRMLFGEWIEIATEIIYYAYDKDHNFKASDYTPNPNHPIWVSFDFNIGEGKPLSMCFAQYIDDTFHFFDEVVVDGFRTADALEEALERGLLNKNSYYLVTGDAAGKNRDTRSTKSDYDIINKFFAAQDLRYEMRLFAANPPIRTRHNMVNAYCLNADGKRRLFVYNKAKTLDEGFRLTALKKGAHIIEDDSKRYQHVTTAAGYLMHAERVHRDRAKQHTRIL